MFWPKNFPSVPLGVGFEPPNWRFNHRNCWFYYGNSYIFKEIKVYIQRWFWERFGAFLRLILGGKKGAVDITCSLIKDLPTFFWAWFFVFWCFFVRYFYVLFVLFFSEVICVDFELTNCLSKPQKWWFYYGNPYIFGKSKFCIGKLVWVLFGTLFGSF